jgi:hypothetical protein
MKIYFISTSLIIQTTKWILGKNDEEDYFVVDIEGKPQRARGLRRLMSSAARILKLKVRIRHGALRYVSGCFFVVYSYSSSKTIRIIVNVHKMGRARSMRERKEECTYNFGEKARRKETTRKTQT